MKPFVGQRGFIQLAPMMWAAIAAGVAIVALSVAVSVQTSRLDTAKKEFATFKGGVEALGRAAEKDAKDKTMQGKLNKEKAGAQNITAHAAVAVPVKRLRNANPSRSILPAAPAGSGRPELACFDRAEYQREDGITVEKLFAGARSLADESTAATIDLDTAKLWAQGAQITADE